MQSEAIKGTNAGSWYPPGAIAFKNSFGDGFTNPSLNEFCAVAVFQFIGITTFQTDKYLHFICLKPVPLGTGNPAGYNCGECFKLAKLIANNGN